MTNALDELVERLSSEPNRNVPGEYLKAEIQKDRIATVESVAKWLEKQQMPIAAERTRNWYFAAGEPGEGMKSK